MKKWHFLKQKNNICGKFGHFDMTNWNSTHIYNSQNINKACISLALNQTALQESITCKTSYLW